MDTLPLVAPEQVGLSAARLDRVRKWMHGWVDSGRLAGMVTVVMRRGELAFAETAGKADVERNRPMRPDTIFRIYSMTKPLTSTAIMMLYEEGRFQLDDPISKFIPAFANPRVYMGGSRGKIESVPAEREITFRDLLTHTSGLTYGFMESNPVDALYRAKTNGVDFQTGTTSLKDIVERLGTFPLIAQPGKAWNYSVATDVLGYLVEVISGQPFQVYLKEKVLAPLGMVNTDFHVPADKHDRFAANYQAGPGGKLELIDDPGKSRYLAPRAVNSGGGGLVSTADDFFAFGQMMLSGEGEILSRKSVELMTTDQLTPAQKGVSGFMPGYFDNRGWGFGVAIDTQRVDLQSVGRYGWDGGTGTSWWADPAEDLTGILLSQRMAFPLASPLYLDFWTSVYQAIE